MISAHTVAPERASAAEPDFALTSALTDQWRSADSEAGRRLLEILDGWDADGPAGRLLSLLRRLAGDPSVQIAVSGTTAALPANAMTLRKIALRCGVSSPGTAAEWTKAWQRLGLMDAGPPPTVDLAALRRACGISVGAPPSGTTPAHNAETAGCEPLDMLLRHLREAHAGEETAAAAAIAALAAHAITAHFARHAARSTARSQTDRELELFKSLQLTDSLPSGPPRETAARSTARSQTDRELELFKSLQLTDSLPSGPPRETAARSTARTARRSAEAGESRSVSDTLRLLAPLLKMVKRDNLVPLTDSAALAEALGAYSDDQVLHAQSVLLCQCRLQQNVRSPIGLLVRHARDGAPDYFTPQPQPQAVNAADRDPPPRAVPNAARDKALASSKIQQARAAISASKHSPRRSSAQPAIPAGSAP